MKFTRWAGVAFAAALSLPGALYADNASDQAELTARLKQLEAKVQSQQATIEQFTTAQDGSWLNAQRAEEVKALVKEVLADADTRASLVGDGLTAGHDGVFFIKSPDDSFRLNIGTQIQTRYIADLRGVRTPTSKNDGHEDGFQLRRLQPSFDGYIGNPKFDYNVILQFDRATGAGSAMIVALGYRFDLGDGQYVRLFGGRIYDQFSREALMRSFNQQTVERSAVATIFAAGNDIVEGVGVEWNPLPDYLKVAATYNDGFNSGTTFTGIYTTSAAAQNSFNGGASRDFNGGMADYAFTSRADLKLAGDWKETADVESWSVTPDLQAFLGAGFHYEGAKHGDANTGDTFTTGSAPNNTVVWGSFCEWTVDSLVKYKGFGFMGSFYGLYFNDVSPTSSFGAKNLRMYGATVQAGYLIADKVEPFARYEWIFPDKDLPGPYNPLNIVTIGVNYFIKQHAVKFTLDAVWCLNNVNGNTTSANNTLGTSLTGLGILPDEANRKDQVVIRAQFQLLF